MTKDSDVIEAVIEAGTYWPDGMLQKWIEQHDLEERRIKWIANYLRHSIKSVLTLDEIAEYDILFGDNK